MRFRAIGFLVCLLNAAPECLAQQWEVGGFGGYGVQRGLTAKLGTLSADTGFRSGAAVGAYADENLYRYLSGEVRYLFRISNLKVESEGQEAAFTGRQHIVHYDFLLHPNYRGSTLLPFAAIGAGVKVFQGIGQERVFQPLSRFVMLTKKTETKPMISAGGGIKFKVASHVTIRAEVRDYMTPAPTKVLVPNRGVRIDGWLHDVVPTLGVGITF